eukprot:Stramenopile-MAST_4_protein_3829
MISRAWLLLSALAIAAGPLVDAAQVRYVEYVNGEPVHVADPSALPPASCNKICLHFGQLTRDCDCSCEGLWTGKVCERCSLKQTDCLHGSRLDESKCHCVACPYPFGGTMCDKCLRSVDDCKNGGLVDPRTCSCTDCISPWGGKKCTECQLPDSRCGPGGKVDRKSCSCQCASGNAPKPVRGDGAGAAFVDWNSVDFQKNTVDPEEVPAKDAAFTSWADAFSFLTVSGSEEAATEQPKYCGDCPITAADCAEGSTFDSERCLCTGCPDGRSGPLCNKCHLTQSDCQHGAQLDLEKCSCTRSCDDKYKGLLCDKCALRSRDCANGGRVNTRLCRCEKCNFPFGGDRCDECKLEGSDCGHNGQVCKSRCKCYRCDKPWKGDRCNVCGLRDQDCQHGGSVDTSMGQCQCKCTEQWTGNRCEVCALESSACGPGTLLDKDACVCKGNAAGIASSARKKVEAAQKNFAAALHDAKQEKEYVQTAIKSAVGNPRVKKLLEGTLKAKTAAEKMLVEGMKTAREADDDLATRAAAVNSFVEVVEQAPEVKVFQANVKQGTPTQPSGEIVRCKFSGQPDLMSDYVAGKEYYGRKRFPNYFQHLFVAAECDGGFLPDPRKGDWLSSIASTYHCGISQAWSVLSPNEVDGPGIMWYNDAPCNGKNMGLATVEVHFFLPREENQKHLHLCRFQGRPERVVKDLPCKQKNADGKSSKGCQKKNSHYQDLLERLPGKMDGTTGGPTKNFQQEGDARFWADKVDQKDFDSRGGAKYMPPGFYRHEFEKEECTNGLPPTDRDCLVSFRWGEHCGGDWDWSAKQGRGVKGKPSVSWYTSQECDSARVAVDYFCPPKDTDLLKTFPRRLHTCKFKGDGSPSSNCAGSKGRHANGGAEGRCLEHKYTAAECGPEGLPGKRSTCLVAINQAVQCGNDQDFSISVGQKGATVQWYQEGWSIHRDGNGKVCSKAEVDVQFFCASDCTRKCVNGGRLDEGRCKCMCPGKWTGVECQLCGLEQEDCENGFELDFTRCTCVPPKNDKIAAKRWTGVFGNTCRLAQKDCQNGGIVDKKSCTCVECNEPFTGTFCEKCARNPKTCQRGSKLDDTTCKCSIGCNEPFWGDMCERCPRGVPREELGLKTTEPMECSGAGTCVDMKCQCANGFTGKMCNKVPKTGECTASGMNEMTTTANAPMTFTRTGEYSLLDGAGLDGSVEKIHVLRDAAGYVGVSFSWEKDGKEEKVTVVGKTKVMAGQPRPDIYVNCQPKEVPVSLDTQLGGTIESAGGGMYSIVSPSGTRAKLTVFQVGRRQYVNLVISARLVGGKGACRSKVGANTLPFVVSNRAKSNFCEGSFDTARFRALVTQTSSVSLRAGVSANAVMWAESLDRATTMQEVEGISRFATVAIPKKCAYPDAAVRACCGRVGDSQDWKGKTRVSSLEKVAFKACVRTFCRKTTCSLATTLGRIPANLKYSVAADVKDDTQRTSRELRGMAMNAIKATVESEKADKDPEGC